METRTWVRMDSNWSVHGDSKPPINLIYDGLLMHHSAIFANVFLSGFDGTITASTYAVIGSEFHASNTISWLTTSYLITSTAFQPLYGRFSDILGRRVCFFTATTIFLVGCLGCGISPNIVTLNFMRGLTGLGGGGLVTMATVINSDMIPFKQRGLYQAGQNVLHGFGCISGASLGGIIADTIGWRWCFLSQVPISLLALLVGKYVIKDPERPAVHNEAALKRNTIWAKIDFRGSVLLVLGLSTQLAGFSLGGNKFAWSDERVIACFVASAILLVGFIISEMRTTAIPIMPTNMLKGQLAISNLVTNVGVGMAAYSVS
jgi:MFS family permease